MFFPSYKLSNFVLAAAEFELPTTAHHGQSLVFARDPELAVISINGKAPVPIGGDHFFYGVGLYAKPNLTISGTWQSESMSPFRNFFSLIYSPETYYFSEVVPVVRPSQLIKTALRIPASTWKRVRKKDPKKEAYRKTLRQAFQRQDGELENLCFKYPLKKRINSPFGKGRILPNGHRYYHSGVDLKAATGTPLPAMMDGEVVFADKTVVPGNTVVVYHGSGLTSQYMHMSQLDVQPGDSVERGQNLGLSGATGRVEGPHLHWEVHWNGAKIDPIDFVDKMNQFCGEQRSS